MNSVAEVLPLLQMLVDGFGKHFGANVEFVVHDYSKDFDSTIVAIANGNVTGREVNRGGTLVGLKMLQGLEKEEGRFNYFTQTHDGRFLRSSTLYLKNDAGKVIGSVCVNVDVTKMIDASNFLKDFIGLEEENARAETIVFNKVEDLLVAMIQDSINYVGTPVALMSKQQKIDGIKYLADRGAMRIKNAGDEIAKYYDISKYTIYNYLNEASNTLDSESVKEDIKC